MAFVPMGYVGGMAGLRFGGGFFFGHLEESNGVIIPYRNPHVFLFYPPSERMY